MKSIGCSVIAYFSSSCCSCLEAHPVPSLGTMFTLGSLPLFSALRLGRLAGGGILREMATFPRLCNPWRAATVHQKEEKNYFSLSLKFTMLM